MVPYALSAIKPMARYTLSSILLLSKQECRTGQFSRASHVLVFCFLDVCLQLQENC